jgi:hypothetical protein
MQPGPGEQKVNHSFLDIRATVPDRIAPKASPIGKIDDDISAATKGPISKPVSVDESRTPRFTEAKALRLY